MIGHGYAHVQHGMDLVIEWGFKKIKETEKQQKADTIEQKPTYTGRVKTAARGVFGFIGTAGQSYFAKYEELKRSRKP